MIRSLIAAVLLLCPAVAFAAPDVAVTSTMLVERVVAQPGGVSKVVLERRNRVLPGAHLVFALDFTNTGRTPKTDFVLTNPIPAGVAFDGVIDGGATMSVDGGRNWAPLPALRVRNPDGTSRPAQNPDVTTVRWVMPAAIAPGGRGTVRFKAIVK